MRKISFILFSILILLCGCGKVQEKTADLHEVIHSLENISDFGNATEESLINQDTASLYGISSSDIKQGYVYYSTEQNRADKIIILEAKDKSSLEKCEKALAEFLNSQVNSWSNKESEYKKVQNHILKTNGNFVIFAIGTNTDKMEEIFDKACQPV